MGREGPHRGGKLRREEGAARRRAASGQQAGSAGQPCPLLHRALTDRFGS